jgi:hypothetical protein
MKPPIKVILVIIIAVMLTQLNEISETLGPIVGLIGGVLGVVALLITGIKPLCQYTSNLRYRKQPFKMWFTKIPFEGEPLKADRFTIHIGKGEVTLVVQSKKKVNYEEIHLALVNYNFSPRQGKYDDHPSRENACIRTLLIGNNDSPDWKTNADRTNGIRLYFNSPFKRLSDQLLYLTVIIESKQVWEGLLMFESEAEGGFLGRSYVKLFISNKANNK